MITSVCRGEEQTSRHNLIFWTEVEQVSIVGRSSRCNVHVRKTELAKNGKFVVLFVFTWVVMRNVVETWVTLFYHNIGTIWKRVPFCRQIISLLAYARLKAILLRYEPEYILCCFVFFSFINSVLKHRSVFKTYP